MTENGWVSLEDNLGTDITVVNAARVSFGKRIDTINDSDIKLISYLAKHNHWSPFSHCYVVFRIRAPIFVARQLVKHQVGLAWNEISRRYIDKPPEFWYPFKWREKAKDKKQGSTNHEVHGNQWIQSKYETAINLCETTYDEMIKAGVCPEQARAVLPQSVYTEWYWSGSLYAFARVCNLRLSEDAQEETRWVAEWISQHMNTLYPISWPQLMKHKLKKEEDMSNRMKEIYDGTWPGPGV